MKLNYDCLRDVLLTIENQDYGFVGTVEDLKLTKYSDEDVRYSVEKLVEAGYITGNVCSDFSGFNFLIRSLSFDGHSFLDNIRPQEVWDKTKTIINSIGSASIEIVSNVAAQVITQIITKSF